MCEICQNWARVDGKPTDHSPNCPYYNDSLIDVWKVTFDGVTCYVANEQDARETAGDEQNDYITVTQEKMHREIFNQMPEFPGF